VSYPEPQKKLKYSKSDINPEWVKWADIEMKNQNELIKDKQKHIDLNTELIGQKNQELIQKDREIERLNAELEAERAVEFIIPDNSMIHVLRELDIFKIKKSTNPALWILLNKLKKQFEWKHEEVSWKGFKEVKSEKK
jgi:hypothetical protein